jgi:hypothetical protein
VRARPLQRGATQETCQKIAIQCRYATTLHGDDTPCGKAAKVASWQMMMRPFLPCPQPVDPPSPPPAREPKHDAVRTCASAEGG